MKAFRYALLVAAALVDVLVFTGCADDFDPQSKLQGLRIIDVSINAPYAAPGSTVHFAMKAVETDAKAYTTLWLNGGCENPPGDLPRGCLDTLNARIAELPSFADQGSSFDYTVPADLISSRPPPVDGSTPYGLSYVYYAVCTGELRYVDPPELDLALGCFDGETRVDASGFITGYTPVFAYDALRNAPPEIGDIVIADTVRTCNKKAIDDCPDIRVDVIVDAAQSEVDADGQHELVWATFFTTAGEMVEDTRVVVNQDGEVRDRDDSHGTWHVAPGYTGPATIYVTLYDSRGGSTWTSRDVMVTP